jgi:hypothetical protein
MYATIIQLNPDGHPMADMTSTLLQWRRQHANKLFAVYGVALFAGAAILLGRAWLAGEFVLAGSGGLIVAACSYLPLCQTTCRVCF